VRTSFTISARGADLKVTAETDETHNIKTTQAVKHVMFFIASALQRPLYGATEA
jgi:hypothetical protein